jgi:hypothetical protein
MIQHRDTLMSGANLLQQFNQHQRSNFVIVVLQKANSFNRLCGFCISACEMSVRRTAQSSRKPFVKGAFISSIVESAFIGVVRSILKRFVQLLGSPNSGFNWYRCDPIPVIRFDIDFYRASGGIFFHVYSSVRRQPA